MEDDDSVNISVENILPVSDTKEDIENQEKIAAEQGYHQFTFYFII